MSALSILIFVLLAAVVAVLALGIGSFGREGTDSAKRSNKMMQWRIGLQAAAVLAILLFIYLSGTSGGG